MSFFSGFFNINSSSSSNDDLGSRINALVQERVNSGLNNAPVQRNRPGNVRSDPSGLQNRPRTPPPPYTDWQPPATAGPSMMPPGLSQEYEPMPVMAENPGPMITGSIAETTAATTEVYSMILRNVNAYYKDANYEPIIPQSHSRNHFYHWKIPQGPLDFPPHLAYIPTKDQNPLISTREFASRAANYRPALSIPTEFMNLVIRTMAPKQSTSLAPIFDSRTVVETVASFGQVFGEQIMNRSARASIAAIEQHNRELLRKREGIYTVPNIGERQDWFTDEVFAQQHLTGPNPCTLEKASTEWVQRFTRAAERQARWDVCDVISVARYQPYIQDYSDIRSAMGVGPGAELRSGTSSSYRINIFNKEFSNKKRYGCASVCLFHLENDGRLHPLGIIIDWRGSMDDSVVIFNKRLTANAPRSGEATDWPWRYAKTCVQCSDWLRHEVLLHLVRTHFVEEAVIVASCRAFAANHPVFRLLEPHWFKTLSLNAAARSVLVPAVIIPLSGATGSQVTRFIRSSYDNFHWTENYIPIDLARRGFPPDRLNDKRYRNCAYARNMILMWEILRRFVSKYLYAAAPDLMTSDKAVESDPQIRKWCEEMQGVRSGAGITTFPVITTREQLIDAVVMCIHIASPQHTAVNYLQEYYQTFVINKPPALYTPLPKSLSELNRIDENALLRALPVNAPGDWLLASHLPHLLSITVAPEENLISYARSLQAKFHRAQGNKERKILEATDEFCLSLEQFQTVVDRISSDMSQGSVEYRVLNPEVMAVSILI
ncbi:lipoxygenase [Kalaharituber pfeilii]|nr:lipoxygenase [Kalaharituber pfeilii]